MLGPMAISTCSVLNEFASVASRKLSVSIAEIREVLATIRALCEVAPIAEDTHDLGLQIADRYRLSIYDAMVVAAALLAQCNTLLSEDLMVQF